MDGVPVEREEGGEEREMSCRYARRKTEAESTLSNIMEAWNWFWNLMKAKSHQSQCNANNHASLIFTTI